MNRLLKKCLLSVTVLALVAVLTTPVMAQGRGGRGMGRMRSYPKARIATLDEVGTELKLTDDQKTKIGEIADQLQSDVRDMFGGGGPPDMDKLEQLNQDASAKVDALLDPAQQKRLSEITIQINGAAALNDPSVQKELKFTEEQTKKYKEAREANLQSMMELFQMSREDRQAKRDEYRKAADDRLLGVLSDEQKTAFEAMKGAPLEVDLSPLAPRFFGGGGGGGGRSESDSGSGSGSGGSGSGGQSN